ncbi:MAG: Tat pathway signal protein, partial [Gemmatimonadota bacterium]|nr:Tat pathway signal protein [Gemmatimonadota bacterium]
MPDIRLMLRRSCFTVLVVASACTNATSITGISGPIPPSALTTRQSAFLDTLERRTFDWFWDRTDPNNGLTPDRWPTKSFSSIAAIGFALTAYPVGVERGYVTRAAAADRTLNALRFMYNAPQGSQPTNVTGYKGFFYHFLDMQTGYRFERVELSTID